MRRKLSAHALCGRCVGAFGMLASAPNGDNPWLNCSHSHPLAAKCSSHPREPEKYEAVWRTDQFPNDWWRKGQPFWFPKFLWLLWNTRFLLNIRPVHRLVLICFQRPCFFYYFFFFFFVSCLRSKDIKPRELATKKWLSKQELQADKHKDLKHWRSPSLCLQQYYGKVHKIQTTELNVGLYACLSLKTSTSSSCSTLSSEVSYSLQEPSPKSSQTLHFVWFFFSFFAAQM